MERKPQNNKQNCIPSLVLVAKMETVFIRSPLRLYEEATIYFATKKRRKKGKQIGIKLR